MEFNYYYGSQADQFIFLRIPKVMLTEEIFSYNIKIYLLTELFNAGSTMSSYYKAMVNHDIPQFAGE